MTKVLKIIQANIKQFYLTYRFAKLVEKQAVAADIIFCRESLSALAGLKLKNKFKNAECIMDACEYPEMSGRISIYMRRIAFPVNYFFKKWDLEYAKSCSHIFTVSPSFKEFLDKRYNKNLWLFKNYISCVDRNYDKEMFSEHFDKSDIVLVCPGQPDPATGTFETIDAINLLPEEYKLLIIGSNTNWRFIAEVESKISDLKLNHRIKYLNAVLSNQYTKILSACDAALILLDTKITQAKLVLPNRFLDSLAAKIPVICCDNVEMKKIIEQYGNGEICKSNNPKEIAETILKLFENGKVKDNYKQNLCVLTDDIEKIKQEELWNFESIFTKYYNDGKRKVAMVARADISENMRTVRICNIFTKIGFEVDLYAIRRTMNKAFLAHPEKVHLHNF